LPKSDGPLGACSWHLSRIECYPSAISPAAEQPQWCRTSGRGRESQPYFVPSTASASDVLTNIAIRNWFAPEDADFYGLPFHHHPTSSSPLASVSDRDSLELFNPLAREDDDLEFGKR